jgi:hypothetical protein
MKIYRIAWVKQPNTKQNMKCNYLFSPFAFVHIVDIQLFLGKEMRQARLQFHRLWRNINAKIENSIDRVAIVSTGFATNTTQHLPAKKAMDWRCWER